MRVILGICKLAVCRGQSAPYRTGGRPDDPDLIRNRPIATTRFELGAGGTRRCEVRCGRCRVTSDLCVAPLRKEGVPHHGLKVGGRLGDNPWRERKEMGACFACVDRLRVDSEIGLPSGACPDVEAKLLERLRPIIKRWGKSGVAIERATSRVERLDERPGASAAGGRDESRRCEVGKAGCCGLKSRGHFKK